MLTLIFTGRNRSRRRYENSHSPSLSSSLLNTSPLILCDIQSMIRLRFLRQVPRKPTNPDRFEFPDQDADNASQARLLPLGLRTSNISRPGTSHNSSICLRNGQSSSRCCSRCHAIAALTYRVRCVCYGLLSKV